MVKKDDERLSQELTERRRASNQAGGEEPLCPDCGSTTPNLYLGKCWSRTRWSSSLSPNSFHNYNGGIATPQPVTPEPAIASTGGNEVIALSQEKDAALSLRQAEQTVQELLEEIGRAETVMREILEELEAHDLGGNCWVNVKAFLNRKRAASLADDGAKGSCWCGYVGPLGSPCPNSPHEGAQWDTIRAVRRKELDEVKGARAEREFWRDPYGEVAEPAEGERKP